MASPKFDHPDWVPNEGAHGSEFGDVSFLRLRFWPLSRSRSHCDPPDCVGTSNIGSAAEITAGKRNIAQVRAMSAVVRPPIRMIELRAGHGQPLQSTSYREVLPDRPRASQTCICMHAHTHANMHAPVCIQPSTHIHTFSHTTISSHRFTPRLRHGHEGMDTCILRERTCAASCICTRRHTTLILMCIDACAWRHTR